MFRLVVLCCFNLCLTVPMYTLCSVLECAHLWGNAGRFSKVKTYLSEISVFRNNFCGQNNLRLSSDIL